MNKIITIFLSFCCASSQLAADDSGVSTAGAGLKLDADASLNLLGDYDLGNSLQGRHQVGDAKYNFLDGSAADPGIQKAWVSIAGEFGEVRAGLQDSLDNVATMSADQHKTEGAYDLIMRSDDSVQRSITYMQQSGPVGVAAQYGTGLTEDDSQSMGVLLNARQGPYEAAIAYQRTPQNQGTTKGRVTYKSRNNSQIRVDIIAERFEVGDAAMDDVQADSMSFMVGAKYKLTPKAYVVGQYGMIGFDNKNGGLTSDDLSLGRDYNALSLEAGYSLNASTSVFISHSQKNYDSSSSVVPLLGDEDASQTHSIGVRLNW